MNIGNALAAGYSIAQTLGFISSNYPNIGKKIKEAQKLGYDVNKIMESFSQMTPKDLESYETSGIFQNDNPWVDADNLQRKKSAYSKIKEYGPKVAGAVVAPLAAYGAYRALKPYINPIIQQGMNALGGGNQPQNAPPPITNPPVLNAPAPAPIMPGNNIGQQINNKINQPTIPGQIASAAQAQIAPQIPEDQTQHPQSIFEQLIQGVDVESLDKSKKDQLKFLKDVSNQLQEKGKTIADPEFKKLNQNIQKTLKGKSGMLMEEATRGMSTEEYPRELAASPGGIGEVTEVKDGKATIDVGGKTHKIAEKDIIKPPREAAIEALELIKGFTPEQERSTHHMLNAYDQEEKKGFFVFHNGTAYVVDDISPEEYKELSEEIEQAKTTGESIIGKWSAGEGSRGSAYNKVVKGIRERKVVPELKKKFRKLNVGYNLLKEWQRLLNEK